MKASNVSLGLVFTVLLFTAQAGFAVPTFQVAAPVDGTPGDSPPFEDTWLVTDSIFDIVVVGAYQAGDSEGVGATASLTAVTLSVSVPAEDPDGGEITITGGDVGATLLWEKPNTENVDGLYFNPNADADKNLLTNEIGNPDTGYDGYQTKNFLPDDQTVDNNHHPFKPGVSNFLIYGIGDFGDGDYVHDYNADEDDPDYVPPGDPDFPLLTGNLGEEKTFTVTVSGFDWVHFDVYGYESYVDGTPSQLQATWMISANSHDTTFIPAPGAMLLAGIGVGMVGWLRGRRIL